MRKRIGLLILAAVFGLAPSTVYAQAYEVPPKSFTGPLSHPRYEDGGFFVGMDFTVWHMDRKIRDQLVAVRGFMDSDGTATGLPAGTFVGSGAPALNTNQLRGPESWQPGFEVDVGWRFQSGVTVTASWLHLADSRYSVSAGPIPPGFNTGSLLQNTFLFSPVTNFSTMYAGPRDLPQSTPPDPVNDASNGALYGIWNGADNMQIELLQRFDMVTVVGRIAVWESENCRMYGLLGPRIITLYERFKWRTVDLDELGVGTDSNNANYKNIVCNRFYGWVLGCGQEWFLGEVPYLGGFSCSIDAQAALYGDFVKLRAKYEREDGATAASRSRNLFRAAPAGDAKISLWWYPWEAIQIRMGYSFMALFNTVASERPIDFNMGTVNPSYNTVSRFMYGFDIGVGFTW